MISFIVNYKWFHQQVHVSHRQKDSRLLKNVDDT